MDEHELLIISEIERDESLRTLRNKPKRVIVNTFFKQIQSALSNSSIDVSKHVSALAKSMEYVTLTGDYLFIDKPDMVVEALNFTDSIEIFPRTDGKFQINLAFYNMTLRENDKESDSEEC